MCSAAFDPISRLPTRLVLGFRIRWKKDGPYSSGTIAKFTTSYPNRLGVSNTQAPSCDKPDQARSASVLQIHGFNLRDGHSWFEIHAD
jgi:hypothetical protein